MSYGRNPFYIWADGDEVFTIIGAGCSGAKIPGDAIAQLVASMEWRDRHGEPGEDGLQAYIRKGRILRGWDPDTGEPT